MESRTRKQEMRYTMALGYAWGRKDGANYSSEAGKRAMCTGSMDFAMWFASRPDGSNLEADWNAFSELSPETQRSLANESKTLPYRETV